MENKVLWVLCIQDSKLGFPSKKGKVYKVKQKTYSCYNIDKDLRESNFRFKELEGSEKIFKVLFGE